MKSPSALGPPGLPKDTLTFTLGVNRPRLAAAARGERRAEAWATADATVEGPTPDPTSPMETPCGLCGQLKEPEVESIQMGVYHPKGFYHQPKGFAPFDLMKC